MIRFAALFLLSAVALPASLAAQDTVIVRRVPRGGPADERAVALFNAENTTRFFGEQTIDRETVIRSDVGVLDGPLRIEGIIMGDLVAINADVTLADGSEVRGNVLVIGGRIDESPSAEIGGTLEQYSERIGVRRYGDRVELSGEPIRRVVTHQRRLRRTYFHQGRASIVVSTGGTYNRVEGLPVKLGARLNWTESATQLRLEGLAIFRTANGFSANYDNRELGYSATGELRLGADQGLDVGGKAYDVVSPIEDWQLTDLEVGLASLLRHRDYRDYYLKRGVAAFARLRAAPEASLFAQLARDELTSVAAKDPWTLFRDAEPWRDNPGIDHGTFNIITAGLDLDTRQRGRWKTGVRLHAEWEHGRSDDVTPVSLPLSVRPPLLLTPYQYDRVFGDLRLDQPVGWGGLQLRALGAGTIGDGELPIQRRLSLGGPDPMPGYAFRRFACNDAVADPALPALCDRMVLFQAEYRGGLNLNPFDGDWGSRADQRGRGRSRWSPDWDWDWDWDWWEGPQFVLFADAGAAWLKSAGFPNRLNWDVGAGIEFGSVGFYAARAIERDQPVRFLVRIHHRF